MFAHLYWTFFKIGAFTLGGGYAMVPLLEREVVDNNAWLNREEFMDILAISQATPGLFAINMASHIGNKLRGVWGGIVCSLGVATPSIVSILLVAMFFNAFKGNIYVEKIFRSIRPAVVALIVSPCFSMAKAAKLDRSTLWIPIVACVLIACFGVSPIWIILATIILGFVYGRMVKGSGD